MSQKANPFLTRNFATECKLVVDILSRVVMLMYSLVVTCFI